MIGLSEATMKVAFVKCHRYFQQRKKKTTTTNGFKVTFLKFFFIFAELGFLRNCVSSRTFV